MVLVGYPARCQKSPRHATTSNEWVTRTGRPVKNSGMPKQLPRSVRRSNGWHGRTNATRKDVVTCCRTFTSRSGGAWLDSTADAPCGRGSTASLTTRRPRRCCGHKRTLRASWRSTTAWSRSPGASEEEIVDRQRALERLHDLIARLKPLDRQVMLLYLEQLDAASIAEITGLSAANVATKVRRIKQLLIQRFHERTGDGR